MATSPTSIDSAAPPGASHIPQSPPPPGATAVTRIEWLIGLVLTLALAAFAGPWIIEYKDLAQWRPVVGLLPFALFLLSPGTLLALALRRRRAPEQVFMFALGLNVLGFAATSLAAVLADLHLALGGIR